MPDPPFLNSEYIDDDLESISEFEELSNLLADGIESLKREKEKKKKEEKKEIIEESSDDMKVEEEEIKEVGQRGFPE